MCTTRLHSSLQALLANRKKQGMTEKKKNENKLFSSKKNWKTITFKYDSKKIYFMDNKIHCAMHFKANDETPTHTCQV